MVFSGAENRSQVLRIVNICDRHPSPHTYSSLKSYLLLRASTPYLAKWELFSRKVPIGEEGHSHTRDHNHARPDTTVAFPLTPAILGESSKLAGAAAQRPAGCWALKNGPKCQELGWTCIPMAVETYGNWVKEALSRLHLAVGLSSQKHQSWMIYTAG
ncbi:hypothetical protein EMCRGX_G023582 [Ephydatia muelleri]